MCGRNRTRLEVPRGAHLGLQISPRGDGREGALHAHALAPDGAFRHGLRVLRAPKAQALVRGRENLFTRLSRFWSHHQGRSSDFISM